ncbi:hypothetical protein ACE7GA_24325 [Roseomonas sp. CCTCC AB2023176]|uniref:hypothetical protein n=1 Tax=Roseomonas sp. CCTCC AB2023176 TaxID=3342640 RepID=UPI0035DEF529
MTKPARRLAEAGSGTLRNYHPETCYVARRQPLRQPFSSRPIHIAAVPTLAAVRGHLEEAASARRIGDVAAAEMAEVAALIALRAALVAPRRLRA